MERLRTKTLVFAVLILGATTIAIWRIASADTPYLKLHVLDVGQGDAIFIELPDSTQILVDGGPDARVLQQLSSVMGPYDRSLDMVIATHPDADHIGGLPDVLNRYDVTTIVDSGAEKETSYYRKWIDAISLEQADVIVADKVQRLQFGDFAYIDILWPQISHLGDRPDRVNDASVVSLLVYEGFSALLTGDIERVSESRLIRSGVLESVDVFMVPHHGSKTSTTAALLEAIQPSVGVISVGKENRYGHPHPSVLSRLARVGIPALRTDQEGSIQFQSDGETFWRVD